MLNDFDHLQSPQVLSSRSYPAEDNLIENFRMKSTQFRDMEKVRVSHEASEQSILSVESDNFPSGGFKNKVWKDNALNIIVIIAKFITFLLSNSEKFKLRFLKLRQFTIIGDKSADYDYYVENGLIRKRKKKLQFKLLRQMLRFIDIYLDILKQKVDPIKPDTSFKITWDIIVFIILLINIIFIPMKISFQLDDLPSGLDIFLDTLPQYIFIIEIILNFNVAFYSKGVLVLNHTAIFKHYFKGKFIVDFIVLIPFLLGRNNTPYLEFVLLFRLSRIMFIFQHLVEFFNLRVNFAALIDIITLLCTFLFSAHLIACVWHFIALYEHKNGLTITWVEKANITDEDWYIRYITSFYWACITTLTIGYGDIVAVTPYEQCFVILVTLVSSIIFGYTISSIGTIFAQMAEQSKFQRDKMKMIDHFMQSRGLANELQIKVKKFFEYYLQLQSDKDSECEKLMQHLSGNLNKEVKIDFYKKFLEKSKLFRQNFSQSFIEKLCLLVREQSFVPEEVISQQGQKVDKIYFIIKGEVEAYINQNKIIKVFHKGSSINDKFFISQHPALYSTRAIKFTKLAYITFDDLQELLEHNLQDREHYFHVKHQIEFRGKVKFQGCEFCFQNHDFTQCPFVFYFPNYTQILRKYKIGEQCARKPWLRKQNKKLNALKEYKDIQNSVLAFGTTLGMYQDVNNDFFVANQIPFYKDVQPEEKESQFQNSNSSEADDIDSKAAAVRPQIRKHSSLLKMISKLAQNNNNSNNNSQHGNTRLSNPELFQTNLKPRFSILGTNNKQTIISINNHLTGSQPLKVIEDESERRTLAEIDEQSIAVRQIDLIQIDIAKEMLNHECNIDKRTDMQYYDVDFNFPIVINKLMKQQQKKKRFFKTQKRKYKKSVSSRVLTFSRNLLK